MKKNLILTAGVVTISSLFMAGCAPKVMTDRGYTPLEQPETTAPVAEQSVETEKPAAVTPETPASEAAVPEKTAPAEEVTYVVKKGDTLGAIGRKYGLHYSEIMQANNIKDARRLHIGQKLVIPPQGVYTPVKESTPPQHKAVKSGKAAKSQKKHAKAVTAAAAETGAVASSGEYIVKRGDSIPKIARKLHVKAADLMAANNLDAAATRRLQIGQKLVVPGTAGVAGVTAPAAEKPATPDMTLSGTVPAASTAAEAKPAEANTAATVTAPAAAAPAATTSVAAESAASQSSTPVEIKADTDIAAFAAANKITVEELKKANVEELPKDGKLKAGTIVFVPTK